jgi:2-oxo-4-hydroxy-4-carboxy--5-ureidoimidazoline (OHCU) decarboxylase
MVAHLLGGLNLEERDGDKIKRNFSRACGFNKVETIKNKEEKMAIKTNSKRMEGGAEMKISKVAWLLVLVCLGFVFCAANIQAAEEEQAVVQELISGVDIPADVASTLASGQGTFGERLEAVFNNGSINQKQYDAITNRFLNLPDEKRWAIKHAWDAGKGINVDQLHNITNPQDPGSVRDHIKDLQQKGVPPDKIKDRLVAQGIDPSIYSNIIGEGPSQRDHAKDLIQQGVTPDKIKDRLNAEGIASGDYAQGERDRRREDVYDELYDMERFDSTDMDGDGVLSKDELRESQKDFEYYSDNARFQHADTDNDGVISLEEAKTEKQWEKQHHEKLEKRLTDDIKNKYPGVDITDAKWLEEHPQVAKEVFQNRDWLKNHPETAQKLIANKEWLSQHPEAAKEIYDNKLFLQKHPDLAKQLYENKEFLKNHPDIAKRVDSRRQWVEEHKDKIEGIKDRREDVKDRREDVRDKREDVKDRREDVRDRREDIKDRREDIYDRKHDGGIKDKREDVKDRREDVRDKREDVKDRREDVRDRREDVKDRREDIKDRKGDSSGRGPGDFKRPGQDGALGSRGKGQGRGAGVKKDKSSSPRGGGSGSGQKGGHGGAHGGGGRQRK